MKLSNKELIEAYYKQEKENYPEITLEQFKDICFAPWRFLRTEMESGKLPEVRLKYFGIFKVHEGRAKFMLNDINKRFQLNKMGKKQYYKLKNILETFLNGKKNKN